MLRKTLLTTTAIALSGVGLESQAATVLIDLSASSSATNPDSNGNSWNSLGTGNRQSVLDAPLIADDGTDVDWTLTVDNPHSSTGYGGTGISGPSGPSPFDQTFATTDGLFNNNNGGGGFASTIIFEELAPSTLYEFSAIGGRRSSGLDGLIQVTTGADQGSGNYVVSNSGSVLTFTVVSDTSGTIAFTFEEVTQAASGAGNSTLNALSITEVPEPSSLALMGLGGLLIARRRRG